MLLVFQSREKSGDCVVQSISDLGSGVETNMAGREKGGIEREREGG